jgi:imidazolonepropionase
MEKADIIIKNANQLITLKGPNNPRIKKEMNELGIIENGCIVIKNDEIIDIGRNLSYTAKNIIDASGKIVTPGFIDPHTHLVFAGSREFELDWKLKGFSYLDIKKRGGGITYTVEKTRKASFNELYIQSEKRLNTMLKYGTTTCEAKSGYGLDLETEKKMLKVIEKLNKNHSIDIIPTFLGAHAIPEEYSTDDYVDIIINEMIPEIKDLSVFCDVFCEKGFFSNEQSKKILNAGKKHGLIPKIHADELNDTEGGALAAEIGAISAEHLLKISGESIKKMSEHKTIGVMLPGTPFNLMMNEYAPARKMIDQGIPIALATDLNPNCWTENMQFIIQLGCLKMNMTPAESICAATYNAACAINKQESIGSLEIGKKADMLILNCENYKFIPYHFGVNHVKTVIKNGKIIK